MKRRRWHRWWVQGHLTAMVTGDYNHSYPRWFFMRWKSADAYRRRLYADHGPGMVRVRLGRVR